MHPHNWALLLSLAWLIVLFVSIAQFAGNETDEAKHDHYYGSYLDI